MDVVSLTVSDCRLLAARCDEHGNSHLRMTAALRETGADHALERLRALRRMERRFEVDLGLLCSRMQRRDRPETHAIERWVLGYVAEWRDGPAPGDVAPKTAGAVAHSGEERHLWVLLDRLREVRQWIEEGRMVSEPGS